MGVAKSYARILATSLAAAALSLGGCDYAYTPSLASTIQPTYDEALVGRWIQVEATGEPSKEPMQLRVVGEAGQYAIKSGPLGNLECESAQLFRVGKLTLAEVTLTAEAGGKSKRTLVAISCEGDTLAFRRLSGAWADDHLIASRGLFATTVGSSPADLVNSLADAGLDAFPGPTTLFTRNHGAGAAQ